MRRWRKAEGTVLQMLMKHSHGRCSSFSKMSHSGWYYWAKYLSCRSRIWCTWPNFNQKYYFYQYQFNMVASFSLRVKKRKSNYDLISHNCDVVYSNWLYFFVIILTYITIYIYILQCGFLSHNLTIFHNYNAISCNHKFVSHNFDFVSCNFNFIFHNAALYCDKSLYISKLQLFF